MRKFTSYDELPLMLNAEELMSVLNISRSGAYSLMHRDDFPTLVMNKRMVVPKDKLLEWVNRQTKGAGDAE